jgi:hypothetical protein
MSNNQPLTKSAENKNISRFISKLSSSDFSGANKHLRSIIENKLLRKISNVKNNPLF